MAYFQTGFNSLLVFPLCYLSMVLLRSYLNPMLRQVLCLHVILI